MKLSTIAVSEMSHHGYGHIAGAYRKWLKAAGETVLAPDEDGWDRLIIFSPPRAPYVGRSFRPDVVYHTMFEAEPVPDHWISILNRVGLVWTPSAWCKTLFREAGVDRPIIVAGYGYDPERFPLFDRQGRDTPLKVLIWGDVLVSRKRVLQAIQAFVDADLPSATLEVKINDSFFRNIPIVNGHGDPYPNIAFFTQPFSHKELLAWLNGGDVLLYLSGGEGFGLQPMEAMATGLPVIAMRETGMTEYMTDGSVLAVPSLGLDTAPSFTAIYNAPMRIHTPDMDAVIQHLWWVHQNRALAVAQGMRGYEAVRHRTWEWAARQAVAELHRYGGDS